MVNLGKIELTKKGQSINLDKNYSQFKLESANR